MFIESLENRQMFSATISTNVPPSQSVAPMANVALGTSKGRQTFADTLASQAVRNLELQDSSPAPGINGLTSASTVMVANSAK